MIDLDLLERRGISAEGLKEILELNDSSTTPKKVLPEARAKKIETFRNRVQLRIQAGRNRNLKNYRTYFALDRAFDLPQRKLNPTLLQSLMDSEPDSEKVLSALGQWGFNLNEVTLDVPDPKVKGKTMKALNVPAFFQIAIPLIQAYVKVRWARISDSFRQDPFFKYEPLISNPKNRLKCNVITSRVQLMARQYGFWNVLKQCCFMMLHYGVCLQFPVEEWHWEEQEVSPGDKDSERAKGEHLPLNDEREQDHEPKNMRTTKEGLRYHMPHPTRMFWDEAHRISTFLTDTGCEFAGYWRVFRWHDIRTNPAYYNIHRVSFGASDFWSANTTFFQSVYGSCAISVPGPVTTTEDRESAMVNNFYTQSNDDQSVVITEYFEKLIPSEYGLGDYDGPVWFRIVVASDDTIIYAAPLAYCPVICYPYDADENRIENASLSLECLPFQDQLSNLMTQFLLSVRQNLANITFVDTDVVGLDWVDRLRNRGEKLYRERNFVPFSGRQAMRSQHGVPAAFFSHSFPQLNVTDIITAMRMILDMLERVLVMSSQEIAQAASHELREKEVVNIQNATSTRLQFTTYAVQDGVNAWKLQVYRGLMAHGDDEFYAEISVDEGFTEANMDERLKDLGFTWDARTHPVTAGDRRVTVKVDKLALAMEMFSSQAEGVERSPNKELAGQLSQALGQWMANPILAGAIGPDQAIRIINLISQIAGLPQDAKLENATGQSMQEQVQQMFGQLEQKILGEVQAGMKPMLDMDLKQEEALKMIAQSLGMPYPPGNADQPPGPTGRATTPAPGLVEGAGGGGLPGTVTGPVG